MGTEETAKLLDRGRDLYLSLLEEAKHLLRTFAGASPEAIGEAVRRRQNLVDLIHGFDSELGKLPAAAAAVLAEFRKFREEITKKILEVDALTTALAKDRQDAIKGKLSAVAKSANAFHAYEHRWSASRKRMNRSA